MKRRGWWLDKRSWWWLDLKWSWWWLDLKRGWWWWDLQQRLGKKAVGGEGELQTAAATTAEESAGLKKGGAVGEDGSRVFF